VDQGRVEPGRFDDEIEAYECPQASTRYEHHTVGCGGMGRTRIGAYGIGNGYTEWGMDGNIDGNTHTERLGTIWH
jgi:hypothetical protein